MVNFSSKMEKAKLWFHRQWGWIVTLSTFIVFFACFGFLYSYGIIFVALKADFQSGATATSWVGSIAIGLHTLGSLISNPLVARFDSRPVAMVGVFMCFSSAILTSFMPSIYPMFLTFSLLFGIGINMVLIAAINLILKYFPAKNCSRATSLALIGTTAGMLAMNMFIYFLIANVGWRNMMRVVGAIILTFGIPAVSTFSQPTKKPTHLDDDCEKKKPLKEKATKMAVESETKSGSATTKVAEAEPLTAADEKKRLEVKLNEKEVKVQIAGKKVTRKQSILKRLKVLTFPELWFLALGLFGCAMTMSFYYVSMVNFMTTVGFSEGRCALVMCIVAVSEVVGKVLLSVFGDHLPFPKIFLFVISSCLGVGVMASMFFATNLVAMMCIAVVTGVFIMTTFDALPYSICNQVFGAARSIETCTVILCANGLGLILGSLFGESVDKTGSYDSAIYVSIGIYVVAIFLFSLVPIYQRCFAPDRYIMARTKPKVVDEFEAMGPFESWIFNPPPIQSTVYMDFESAV